MKYKLFEVVPEDIDEIVAKDCYSVGELGCCKTLIRLSAMNADSITCGFGEGEGVLHGIAGSYRQWDGVAQLWAVFDKVSCKYPIAFTKICESLIRYAAEKQQLKRVSLTVKADYFQGNNFARVLGFTLEGKMKTYLPDGADANLYARFF